MMGWSVSIGPTVNLCAQNTYFEALFGLAERHSGKPSVGSPKNEAYHRCKAACGGRGLAHMGNLGQYMVVQLKQKRVGGRLIFVMAWLALFFPAREAGAGGRSVEKFDWGWRFHRGDVVGGEKVELYDSTWRSVDIPHDWSIEGPFVHDIPGDEAVERLYGKGFDDINPGESLVPSLQGYRAGGVGWYHKLFSLPESTRQKRVFVQFDGVYMNSDTWINGHHLGSQPYGFTSFLYELTPFLHFGEEENVLAVRVNVEQPCSRWYSGAGIYRHVWLTITESVHIAHWGTYVTTPEVTEDEAQVRIQTRVQNQGDRSVAVFLESTILDNVGRSVASSTTSEEIEAGKSFEFDQVFQVEDPLLWSIESPCLYKAVSILREGESVLDETTTFFGVRTFEFTTDRGFILNGKHVAIQGVNLHHDQGCLGAAAYDRAIERQLEILKKMGCNAIRTAHNPPAPAQLDLCDRMGFIVIDEAFDEWRKSKLRNGYGRFFDEWSERDLVSMIRRDRNHPSVVLWSIGNEVYEQLRTHGGKTAQRLAAICRREDPTRPVTSGCNAVGQILENGYADALDVLGINYNIEWHDKLRGKKPLFASETTVALSTRGEYNLVRENDKPEIKPRIGHAFTSYDLASFAAVNVAVGAPAETILKEFENRPWVAGQFVWSGFDYLGEPSPMRWPSRSSSFGIIDLCGFPKDRYYLYQSQWTEEPVLHILPHWNWEGYEGLEIPVWCFTNCESAELFLNGESFGVRDRSDTEEYHFEWAIPYIRGTLKAIGRKNGTVICTAEVHTAGKPARIELRPDRNVIKADGQDLVYVTARILDDKGHLCPNANNNVHFEVEGNGSLVGVGNGDPTSHEWHSADNRSAFHGLCLAVVRSARGPGEITFTATADTLESDRVVIKTR